MAGDPIRVLIADDMPVNLKLLRAVLEGEGFEVIEATNGVEAMAVLESESVDVIISDILMPKMDGYRFCQAVRSDERFKGLPFIVYTATYTSPSDKKFAEEVGADMFLVKPVPGHVLKTAIETCMASERTELRRHQPDDVLKEYSERLVEKLEKKNAELTASLQQLALQSTALETAANAVLITDSKGVIEWVNPAFVRITGYSYEDTLGETPRILKSGLHDEKFYRDFWETIRAGKTFRGEFINRRKNGEIYTDDHTVTPVRSRDGAITHYVGIMNDVTHRRRAEEEARKANAQLHHVLAHSPAIVYAAKIDGGQEIKPYLITKMRSELAEFEVPEDVGLSWWLRRIHPDDRKQAWQGLRETVNAGGIRSEYRLRNRDGGYRWIEDNRRVLRDDRGNATEIIGVWADVTERKESELARSEVEKTFRNILENVGLVSMILSVDGKVQFCNEHLLKLTGWTEDEVLGADWVEKFLPDTIKEEMREGLLEAPSVGIRRHIEAPIMTKSGEIREIFWSNTVLQDTAGNLMGYASLGEDVTERNRATQLLREAYEDTERKVEERTAELARANEELKNAKERADAANQAKSSFLSRMSHEFRTPMNAILGFGQLLEFSDLTESQKENVTEILKGGRHLLGLINDVLEISRIETGSLSISLEKVNVRDVLGEAVSLMKPLAAERSLEIVVEEFPDTVVVADQQRLRQVLLNLLSNAVKYSYKGGTIRTRVGREDGHVRIEVVDEGIGISKDLEERLFVPFDRLGAEATGVEGTGLGLPLSQSLVEAMGGELNVVSEVGNGSTFVVKLVGADSDVIDLQSEASKVDNGYAVTGEPRKVLVIEDNLANTELLAKLFALRPHIQLITSMQGRLGLDLALEHVPDAILLDLHLPDTTGREILLALKAEPKLKDIPVIITSADVHATQSLALVEAGAFRYLTKPFVLEELLRTVDEALARGGDDA